MARAVKVKYKSPADRISGAAVLDGCSHFTYFWKVVFPYRRRLCPVFSRSSEIRGNYRGHTPDSVCISLRAEVF